jgi:hypothetical protein
MHVAKITLLHDPHGSQRGRQQRIPQLWLPVGGTLVGAAGVETTAGGTATGTSVGAFDTPASAVVEFACTGSGGTTYDISDITMRVHYLG